MTDNMKIAIVGGGRSVGKVFQMQKDLLEELEQYRAIGTLEECREAVEKMKPKKPIIQTRGVYDDDTGDWIQDEEWFMCPTCRKRNEVYQFWKSCHYCNQRLLWEE